MWLAPLWNTEVVYLKGHFRVETATKFWEGGKQDLLYKGPVFLSCSLLHIDTPSPDRYWSGYSYTNCTWAMAETLLFLRLKSVVSQQYYTTVHNRELNILSVEVQGGSLRWVKYTGVVVKMQGGLFTCEDLPQTRLPQKQSPSVQNFSPVPPLLDSVQKSLFPLCLVDQLNINLKGRMSHMNYNLCFLQCMGIFRGLWVNHWAPSNLNESYWWHPLLEGFSCFLCCKRPVRERRRV